MLWKRGCAKGLTMPPARAEGGERRTSSNPRDARQAPPEELGAPASQKRGADDGKSLP